MNGFERRKEQKKDRIRGAAIDLFKIYGFGKVSIGDIARTANVSHVTIYNHFGSKEGIVRDVMKTVISDLVKSSREIIEGEKPFMKKLELIIFNKAEMAEQYQGELMKMVVRDYPDMQQFIESLWRQEIDSQINILIKEGKKLGYIRTELSAQAIRYYFEIIRSGAFSNTKMLGEIKVDAKLARDLNCLFLFGLVEKQD